MSTEFCWLNPAIIQILVIEIPKVCYSQTFWWSCPCGLPGFKDPLIDYDGFLGIQSVIRQWETPPRDPHFQYKDPTWYSHQKTTIVTSNPPFIPIWYDQRGRSVAFVTTAFGAISRQPQATSGFIYTIWLWHWHSQFAMERSTHAIKNGVYHLFPWAIVRRQSVNVITRGFFQIIPKDPQLSSILQLHSGYD